MSAMSRHLRGVPDSFMIARSYDAKPFGKMGEPAVEVYSIDEAFADLTGLDELGRRIRSQVLRCTGIPVGVGIASTKTLAKLANHRRQSA
ncbi:DNA polymerase IV [Pseudomonas fluorescens]|uniref:DNA polymerase IV n=1 Tax=Pseudomonas fluorescens TaxID=294 RepID=A0A5E7CWA9_PSEFL|nr:DNA polymerase IV [Pseudomonas fluorescens]